MKGKFVGGMATMLCLSVLLVSCGNDNSLVNPQNDEQLMLAPPAYTEDQINQLILAEAAKQAQAGATGGQCKTWVQGLVQKTTGRIIPLTDTVNPSYYNAQWQPGSDVRVIWQLYPQYYCITQFPSYLKPGQIIQLRWRSTVPWPNCSNGPHTAIIQSVNATAMNWYDSNFVAPNKVGSHPFSMTQWQQYVAAWTVYQVK